MAQGKSTTKKTKRKKRSKIMTIVFLSVFLYALYELSSIFMVYYHNHQLLADVQQIYGDTEMKRGEEEEIVEGEVRDQFNELKEINHDILGWITVDDTKINYPILQAEDNEYYLTRNYEREESIAGSIFMDYRNDITSYNPNIILYGHRMKDDSIFNGLDKFIYVEFFYIHIIIYFDMMFIIYVYEI